MKKRMPKILTVLVFGSLLAVSCSKPAETPASSTEPDTKPVTEAQPAPAPVEVTEPAKPEPAPKPPVKKTPVAKNEPAPAPVPVVPVPAPVPAPSTAPAPAPVASAPAPVPVPAAPPAPVLPTTKDVSIPTGTLVEVRMIDSVDSKTDKVGQTYKASLDAPMMLNGETIFPKGSEVFLKLIKVDSAGSLKGKSEVQLQIDRVYLGSKAYTVTSNVFQSTGSSQGNKAVKRTGIGAGIGAAIGAIAGGGKGAAIGAGIGGGAGAASTAISGSEQVRIESEEKVDFRLEGPLNVTVPIAGRSTK